MRLRVLAVCTLLALAACTGSNDEPGVGPSSSAHPSASSVSPGGSACPALGTQPVAASGLTPDGPFVAGDPTKGLACYWGPGSSPGAADNQASGKPVGTAALARIAEILNAAPTVGPDIVDCPPDDGQDMFFRFTQAGAPTQEVLASLTGCRSAYNGVRSVWLKGDAAGCLAELSGFAVQGGTGCHSA